MTMLVGMPTMPLNKQPALRSFSGYGARCKQAGTLRLLENAEHDGHGTGADCVYPEREGCKNHAKTPAQHKKPPILAHEHSALVVIRIEFGVASVSKCNIPKDSYKIKIKHSSG